MKERPKIARCDCGNVYAGEEHYYKTMWCSCGRWLHWDKHSNIDQEYTQFESEVNLARERREGY